MSHVLDAAYPVWTPESLRQAGVAGVARYLSWEPNSKVIQKAEYDALLAAGITVMLNWESTGRSWRNGFSAGYAEGKEARRQARALGHPDTRPVIQSIDENVDPHEIHYALDYQRGFNLGGGCGPQGCYSTALVLDAMHLAGLIIVGWQTNARGWYGNAADSQNAALLQRTSKSYPQFPENSYDESDPVRADWGQHPSPSIPPIVQPPKPIQHPVHPITGGKIVDLTKTKTTVLPLAWKGGFGLFEGVWQTGHTVAACWATTLGPDPRPGGPDSWWEGTIEGQVRAQYRGSEVIVTAFFPKWKNGEPLPAAHVFAVPA